MDYFAPSLTVAGRTFDWGSRTYVMAILNVSPESFSGDGVTDLGAIEEQARRFADDGADLIDVGGLSTRPGFAEISIEAETARVVPAIEAVRRVTDLPVSVDTYRAEVARAALDVGAHVVNDVTGLRGDEAMAALVAERGVPAVLMHNQRGRAHHDVIEDVRTGFEASLSLADEAGVPRKRIILDPGFGFGWTVEQNMEMLRRVGELRELDLPLLVGTSRKSSIGAVLGIDDADERVFGTAATVAVAIANGADIVRVHDVREMTQVVRMTDAIVRGGR